MVREIDPREFHLTLSNCSHTSVWLYSIVLLPISGGMGMTKYIDLKETKRLERLKTVKSSIGISSLTSHSG